MESTSDQHFLAEIQKTDGSRGESLTSCLMGLQSPFAQTEDDEKYLTMDGRAIFDFAIRDVAQSIKDTIEASPLEVDEIDYFLLHQANDRILNKIAKKLGVILF